MLPKPDPTKARTPHRRQAFTQLPQGSKNALRELNRQRSKRTSGPCSEVRVGKLQADGSIVWYDPNAETIIREQERANAAEERKQRQERILAVLSGQQAQTDSWAHKS